MRYGIAAGVVCLAVAGVLPAEVKMPPIWPQIQGVFPRGGQQGTEVSFSLKGRNLQEAREILFTSGKLQAKVVSSDAYEVRAVVSIAPDAEPGRHDLRLISPSGAAIGYFDVSTYPERLEKEPNDDPARAEALLFPALVNGLLKSADYDYFRFDAQAGQVLTFDVLATRLGANTDAVITILDEAGEELAYSDDYYGFKDPHLKYRFPKSGSYYLRISGSSEAGCDTCDYRLVAGAMPHVDMAMPGGGTRGKSVEFSLRGVNLESVKEVVLGDGLARGEVIGAGFGEARVRMEIPEGVEPGEYRLHVRGATLPVPFVVSPYPEVTVADGSARNRKDPVPVSLPVVANGVLDRPRAADHFVFRIDEPKAVLLEAHAMQLGFLTDPLVAVYDENGERIAYQDEPTTNTGKEPANMDPHLVVKLPKAGRYVALVRDAQFRGDAAFFYRLTMKEAAPDFSIRAVGTDLTLYRGRTNTVLVRVRRLEGWDAPVEVWAENLPPGVRAGRVVAKPENTPYTGTCGETHYLDGTNVEMEFTVDPDAPLTGAQIVFRGRGEWDGKPVERTGKARYFRSRIRHIGDAEEDALRAVVADAPGVVLGVPANLTLEKDGSGTFTAIVTRLDGTEADLELSLEAAADGLELEADTVPAASTRAEIRVRDAGKGPGEFVLVGKVNGTVIGKSHPIRVRRKQ